MRQWHGAKDVEKQWFTAFVNAYIEEEDAVADPDAYRSPIVRFGMAAFGVLLLIVAPFVAYGSIVRFLDGQQSTSWPTAEATIREASIDQRRTTTTSESFTPRVEYGYAVDGQEHVGTAISHHDVGYGDRGPAEKIVGRYAVGSAHTAYYDPADHAVAVLEPGNSWRAYLMLAVPLFMVGFGVVALWAARSLKPDRQG